MQQMQKNLRWDGTNEAPYTKRTHIPQQKIKLSRIYPLIFEMLFEQIVIFSKEGGVTQRDRFYSTLCIELISPINDPSRVVMYASSIASFIRTLFIIGEIDFLNCLLDKA